MKMIRFEKNNYIEIVQVIKNGGLVISPSDTVYGLLADSTNKKAVDKLIKFKSRPPGKAISVFVSDFPMMKEYVEVQPREQAILNELLPGPFTVILRSKHRISKQLESEKGTLGVRIPRSEFLTDLVKKIGRPVTATSANMSGKSPHYQIDSLLREIPQSKKNLIDLVIDGGKLPHNKPSTVIDLTTSTVKTLRYGDIVRSDSQSYISTSEDQTKKIGQYLLHTYGKETKEKPLVFIIKGELGVGKTVMVKGIAESLGIHNIISPTFVVYYEYKTSFQDIKLLFHFDLYQIQDPEEFEQLGIKDLLKSNRVLCFEWGEKTGEIINILKNKSKIIYVTMRYINERKRKITVNQ